jgi:hypothetical protein
MQVEELDSNDLVNLCVQGDKESLQEYMHRVVKLTARVPGVSESSTIGPQGRTLFLTGEASRFLTGPAKWEIFNEADPGTLFDM